MSPEAAGLPVAETQAGQGLLIAVVGPSGAGKDSLIDFARQLFADDPAVMFVRRVVTRVAQASAEDHDTLSPENFDAAEASGRFAVTWRAHGLHYAIPADALRHAEAGGVAVVNGSRAALPDIRAAFGNVLVVLVTCRPEVLAARLAARGREDAEQQKQRVARSALPTQHLAEAVEIDNSGDLASAGEELVGIIRAARATGRATA